MICQTVSDAARAAEANRDNDFLQVYEYICKTLNGKYAKRMHESRLEDMIGYVTLYVLRKWKGYDSTRGVKPTTYAHKAIVWGVQMFFKVRNHRDGFTSVPLTPEIQSYLEAPEEAETPSAERQRERIALVTKFVLDNATDRQRDCFELYVRGESNIRIADALGISPQAVSVHLTRCRQLAVEWEQENLSDD